MKTAQIQMDMPQSAQSVVTAKMIAEKLGLSCNTVKKVLTPGWGGKGLSVETIRKVKETAEKLGYDPEKARNAAGKISGYYQWMKNSNFPTVELETARMLELRNQGYPNILIAKKIGRSIDTVYSRIGCQPAEITEASVRNRSARRRMESESRRAYVEKVKTEKKIKQKIYRGIKKEYDECHAELEQTFAKVTRLAEKQEEIKIRLNAAAKEAGITIQ